MELATRNYDPSWDRIVYLYVDKCDGISEFVNAEDTYKIVVVEEGSFTVANEYTKRLVTSPALLLLTDEILNFSDVKGVKTTTVYLKPTEIREEFTTQRIASGEFENENGRTIYQDYLLVKSFIGEDESINIFPLSLSAYSKISKTVEIMANELVEQKDDFWPCRSRSYMMELLYFISYACIETGMEVADDYAKDDTVNKIIAYFSEHIGDKITLEDVIKEFGLNRNRLNEIFVKETSMTCLNYLTKMRINLAQIMLAETELQIAEISDRVGYLDSNYFIKVFKKYTGVTPSKYRDSFSH